MPHQYSTQSTQSTRARSAEVKLTVKELLGVEGKETLEDSVSDTSSTEGSDDLVLEVVGVTSDGSDVPVSTHDLLVGGDKVSDQEEDGHDW